MLLRLQKLALAKAFSSAGSKPWLVIGAAVWLVRLAGRAGDPGTGVIHRTVLAPGEQLVISERPPATRRGRSRRG